MSRAALFAFPLLAATATSALAQPTTAPRPEPLPMGVPYAYQPGNPYWYAPVVPVYAPYYRYVATVPAYTPYGYAYVPAVPYPYPFASSGPVYGRYSWDYTGQFTSGYGAYSTNLPHYPYSYQYPTLGGRVWMGYGW